MKKHPVLVAAAAVLLLGVAAVAVILLGTRGDWLPWSQSSRGPEQAQMPAAQKQAEPTVLVPAPQGPEPWNQTMTSPAPPWFQPGDRPHVEAAPAPVLPKKKEDRQQLELDTRKQKFASAMEELNRRAARRAGLSPPIPAAVPPAPAAYNSRRSVLTTAETARRPGEVEQRP